MCARKYIHEKNFIFSWLVFFGVCVSSVIEKSLADSRKAGRPINPFMIMTKLLSKVRF